MTRRGRIVIAWAASFSAYAIPVVSPHWADLLGVALFRELGSDRELSWKTADVLMAVGLQAVLFVTAWISAGYGRVSVLLGATLAWVPMALLANLLYMAVIPARFLIEADRADDVTSWEEECILPGYSLVPVRAGVSRTLEQRGEAWARRDDGARYGIMRVPGCQVEPVALPDGPMTGLDQALADGGAVYSTMEPKSGTRKFWLLARGAKDGIELVPPGGVSPHQSSPLVSEDGAWVAWISRGEDRVASIRILPTSGRAEPLVFTHELLQRATISPVELDMAERKIVINRGLRTFVAIRLDGSVAWGPIEAPVAAQHDTFRYLRADRWLAWDAYVEKGPYRLAWPSGSHAIPRGSVINSAAIDSSGRLVAVSSSTGLSIGAIPDRVVVMSASDNSVVFRKTPPRYTRSQVAFLGSGYFAYSDFDGNKGAVRVLRSGAP